MTDAAYLVIRLTFLALLWLFVLAAVRAVRCRDRRPAVVRS